MPLIEPERGCERRRIRSAQMAGTSRSKVRLCKGAGLPRPDRLPCVARPAVKVDESPSPTTMQPSRRGRQVPNRVYGTLPGSQACSESPGSCMIHGSLTQGVGTSVNRRNGKTEKGKKKSRTVFQEN